MIVTCRYSGVEFKVPNFPNLRVNGEHPLFHVPLKTLLSRTKEWSAGRMNAEECRILFLSLLNSTGLVKFDVTAIPSNDIVQRNMEGIIFVAGWTDAISTNMKLLRETIPQYRISNATRGLDNINHWIAKWNEAKDDWQDGYRNAQIKKMMMQRGEALEKLIRSPYKNKEDYGIKYGRWALSAAKMGKDDERYERYLDIFRKKGIELIAVDKNDIREVIEFLEINLADYVGTILHNGTMTYIRGQLNRNENALTEYLDKSPSGVSLDDLFINDDFDSHNLNTFELLPSAEDEHPMDIGVARYEHEVERHNKIVAFLSAPLKKPEWKDFEGGSDGKNDGKNGKNNKFEFMKAEAAYRTALAQRNRIKRREISIKDNLEALSKQIMNEKQKDVIEKDGKIIIDEDFDSLEDETVEEILTTETMKETE
jgi:hypothetical protein